MEALGHRARGATSGTGSTPVRVHARAVPIGRRAAQGWNHPRRVGFGPSAASIVRCMRTGSRVWGPGVHGSRGGGPEPSVAVASFTGLVSSNLQCNLVRSQISRASHRATRRLARG
jgi:hypothetical protein